MGKGMLSFSLPIVKPIVSYVSGSMIATTDLLPEHAPIFIERLQACELLSI